MKLKKVILLATVFLVLTSTSFAKKFSDLNSSHWAYNQINKLQERGILTGFEDGTFKPNQAVTREQFATILVKALDLKARNNKVDFVDIEPGRWSRKYIEAASLYLTGYLSDGDYYFKPTEDAVREDMALAVVKARGMDNETPDYTVLNKFSDKNEISESIKKYVAIAVKNGIMNGNSDGTFNPLGSLTRAEIAILMFNVSEKVVIGEILEEEEDKTKYPITITTNNCAEVEGVKQYEVGEEVTIRLTLDDGYEFIGWQSATGVSFDEIETTKSRDKVTSIFTMPKTEVLLTANIQKKAITAKYPVYITANYCTEVEGFDLYASGEEVTVRLTLNDGYEFIGWQSVTGVSSDKIKTTKSGNKVTSTFTMPNTTVLLAADIQKKAVTLKYPVDVTANYCTEVDGAGRYAAGEEVTVRLTVVDGYKFIGWQSATGVSFDEIETTKSENNVTSIFTMPNTAVKITANVVRTYAITFNANGGTGSMSDQSFTHGVAQRLITNSFTKTGYSFAGWATTAGGTLAYADRESYSATANVTLYAKWMKGIYQVFFYQNGGTGPTDPQTFYHGDPQTIQKNTFTRVGYTFAGWATSPEGIVEYADEGMYTATSDANLYAKWVPNTYTVSFDVNGHGSGSMSPQIFTYGVAQNLKLGSFTWEPGYTFAGWNTKADGTGTGYLNGRSYTATADVTLYAVWWEPEIG